MLLESQLPSTDSKTAYTCGHTQTHRSRLHICYRFTFHGKYTCVCVCTVFVQTLAHDRMLCPRNLSKAVIHKGISCDSFVLPSHSFSAGPVLGFRADDCWGAVLRPCPGGRQHAWRLCSRRQCAVRRVPVGSPLGDDLQTRPWSGGSRCSELYDSLVLRQIPRQCAHCTPVCHLCCSFITDRTAYSQVCCKPHNPSVLDKPGSRWHET